MTTRDRAPVGAPCWTDLWTSDVDGSRKFYSDLLGWEAQDPDEDHGGYFMFTRGGLPMAGGMGDMGVDLPANDTWKVYLATDDLPGALAAAEAGGAQVISPAMSVDDLGTQAVLVDPTGATFGTWQAGTFPGFTVLDEPGAPSWFELHTRDHAGAVAFYRDVFGLHATVMADSDEFRYTTLDVGVQEEPVFGIIDARGFLPEGAPSHWVTYWEVEDIEGSFAKVGAMGGAQLEAPVVTPYGHIATVADPAGAMFKLRTGPR